MTHVLWASRFACTAGVLLCALATSGSALADGKRDLEDGIAFYENLDTDRAMDRLTRATQAADLGPADRAKAYLYLGMLQFEIGSLSDARGSWGEAMKLDRSIKIPEGTSPKTIEAIEEVRAKAADPKVAPADRPKVTSPPPPPAVETPPPPPPPLTEDAALTEAPPADGGSNTWLWVGIGAGAAVVVATVIIVVAVAAGGGSDCEMGAGGCLGVLFQ